MKTHDTTMMSSRTQLMIWDTDPKTYNLPNRNTNVNSKDEINVGDRLLVNSYPGKVRYTVNEIISKKPSSLSGYTYYELLTTRG